MQVYKMGGKYMELTGNTFNKIDCLNISQITNTYITYTVADSTQKLRENDKKLTEYYKELLQYGFLFRFGALSDIRDENSLTPLHISIINDHEKIFDFLMDNGASVNAIARSNILPMYTAAEYDRLHMLQGILSRDASQMDKHDAFETRPIHVAAAKGSLKCLEQLLKSNFLKNSLK